MCGGHAKTFTSHHLCVVWRMRGALEEQWIGPRHGMAWRGAPVACAGPSRHRIAPTATTTIGWHASLSPLADVGRKKARKKEILALSVDGHISLQDCSITPGTTCTLQSTRLWPCCVNLGHAHRQTVVCLSLFFIRDWNVTLSADMSAYYFIQPRSDVGATWRV